VSRSTRSGPVPAAPVLVVGAGAVGAACASALARAGLPVLVLGRSDRSTTRVSGGHLLRQSKVPGRVLALAQRSLELVRRFAAGRETELAYQQCGSLIVAADAAEAMRLSLRVEALQAAGAAVEWLDGEQARLLEPELAPTVTAASYCPEDAQVDPAALAAAWLRDATDRGARVVGHLPVEELVCDRSGRLAGVATRSGFQPAAAVVLAAGPWSGELARTAGLELGIRPRRGVLLVGKPGRPLTSRPLLGGGYLEARYGSGVEVAFSLQQHPDGTCILGGCREFVAWDSDPSPQLTEEIVRLGSCYLPALSEVSWTEVRVGFRPWCERGEPWIGACAVPGLFLACGHEGDGISLAAATAERVAAAVTRQFRG